MLVTASSRLIPQKGQPTPGVEHIGNNTTRVCQGRRAKSTGEETQDNQRVHVLGTSRASAEGSQAKVGEEKDDLSAVEFCSLLGQSSCLHPILSYSVFPDTYH